MPRKHARIAVDIGGTFTDVVLERADGSRVSAKRLTTHADPGAAVLAGIDDMLAQAGVAPGDVGLVLHGTTLATNALIERRGARTALLTTAGHRDALAMAHEDRFEQYDFNINRPEPLVPRYLRLPITERMSARGEPLVALDEASIDAAIDTLRAEDVASVAIGFLHAYANPDHERRTAERVRAALPGVSITLAAEVCPEIREYERLSTACANAYIKPVMDNYLGRLAAALSARGLACPFLLMTSGGGLTTLETATRFPIRLVESGPAGGAMLAAHVARGLGLQRLLSLDMGGTTAKLCFVDEFEPRRSRSFEIDRVYRFRKGSGLPVRIPVIDMVEIGAGGGSIASTDKLRRLCIGPESAGSEPGPAAYGRGGERPTVTDADLMLGKLVAKGFAGGRIELDRESAAAAVARNVGQALGLDTEAAAAGISEVVDENMAAAARAHAAEFGLDIAQRDLVAFGGAAPLHAARLGEKLGVRRIVVPVNAGVGSAVGFLLAPVSYEVVRSRHQLLSKLDVTAVNGMMREMQDESAAVVSQAARDEELVETRQAYMRYVGQGHELVIGIPARPYTDDDAGLLRRLFEDAYRSIYGHLIEDIEIEVLSWTLSLAAPASAGDVAGPSGASHESAGGTDQTVKAEPGPSIAPCSRQPMLDAGTRESCDAPVFERDELPAGATIEGPALITESQTTTVVSARYRAHIDPRMNIVLTAIEASP